MGLFHKTFLTALDLCLPIILILGRISFATIVHCIVFENNLKSLISIFAKMRKGDFQTLCTLSKCNSRILTDGIVQQRTVGFYYLTKDMEVANDWKNAKKSILRASMKMEQGSSMRGKHTVTVIICSRFRKKKDWAIDASHHER